MKRVIILFIACFLLCSFAVAKESWTLKFSAPTKGTQQNPKTDIVKVSIKIKGTIGGVYKNETVQVCANVPVHKDISAADKMEDIAEKVADEVGENGTTLPAGWADCIISSTSQGNTMVNVEVNTEFESENDVEVDIKDIDVVNNSGQKKVKIVSLCVDCDQGPTMVLRGEPDGQTTAGGDSVVCFGVALGTTEYTAEVTVGSKTKEEILIELAVELKSMAANAGYTINPIVYGYGIYVVVETYGVAAGSDDEGLGVSSTLLGSEYYDDSTRFEGAIQSWITDQLGIVVSSTATVEQGITVYSAIE